MNDFEPTVQTNQYGKYIRLKTDDRKSATKLLHDNKIRYDVYPVKWTRSGNYRRQFFKEVPGPYRCRYCHKRLEEKEIQIDHVIPVKKARTSHLARNLLYVRGINDINDLRNLAPSCPRCNQRKGDKLWVIRGFLGQYKWFWPIYRTIEIVVILLFLFILFKGSMYVLDLF